MTTSRRSIRTAKGPLVTLPYTIELNDIPMMIVHHHESDYLTRRAIDQFDRLYEEGERPGKDRRAGDPSVHQRATAPHQVPRAIYDYVNQFDGVLHWNGAQILDWYMGQTGKGK